jgi:hypothetical protein
MGGLDELKELDYFLQEHNLRIFDNIWGERGDFLKVVRYRRSAESATDLG